MGDQKRESRMGMRTVIEGLVLVLIIAASVPPQADELVSNLDEANGGIAKVWSAQHHAQTFATGGHELGYLSRKRRTRCGVVDRGCERHSERARRVE